MSDPTPASPPDGTVTPARGHALSEDRAATIVGLAALTCFLEQTVPAAAKGTAFAGIPRRPSSPSTRPCSGCSATSCSGVRGWLAGGFRTELFIKTGLVLLGASINFAIIMIAAGQAIPQALVPISVGLLLTTVLFSGFAA